MGRPPSNGGPSFRFNAVEVAEMENILKAHNTTVPGREVLEALSQKFSSSAERSGKVVVQVKQVWNWFQNKRYALRGKGAKAPGKLNVSLLPHNDSAVAKNVPQAPQPVPAAPVTVRYVPQAPQHLPSPAVTVKNVPQAPQHLPGPAVKNVPQVPQHLPAPAVTGRNVTQAPQHLVHAPAVQGAGRNGADSNSMEFEAKSARDGAWYDVATFLSHRNLETGDPEVLVRFAGFGAEEDEWVNICKLVRQRSLPCESSECVAVLPGDLILCFQEGKEQALYFDAHVLDAQRRRHDVRGCRCRFLVRYDHDQSEEIVPLRKVCRRPETDYRLQQLHALNDSATANQPKAGLDSHTPNTLRVYPPPTEPTQKKQKVEERSDVVPMSLPAASHTNVPAVKVEQPKATEISNSTVSLGNPNVPPSANVVLQQPKVSEKVNAATLDVPPGFAPKIATATNTMAGGHDQNIPQVK